MGSLGLGDLLDRGTSPGEMGDNLPAVDLTFGAGLGAVSNIFAGRFHTCVSGTEGGLACFGLNVGGQLGSGNDETNIGDQPGEVEKLTSIDLGAGEVVSIPDAPGLAVALETISPTTMAGHTPAPSGSGSPRSAEGTRSPELTRLPTAAPLAFAGQTSPPHGSDAGREGISPSSEVRYCVGCYGARQCAGSRVPCCQSCHPSPSDQKAGGYLPSIHRALKSS